jgi:RimJ/RimL family protein N-acetyltransferase
MFFDGHAVRIRRYRPEDAPALFDAVRESLDELCTFLTWCHPDYRLEESRAFIAKSDSAWEKGEEYNFAILDAAGEILLGGVGLNRIDRVHNFANLGYWVRRSRARRGVMTSATRLIAKFGLMEIGFNRLEILVSEHNLASQRVAEKAGAKFEGVLRNRLVLAGRPHNAFVYSLIAADLTGDSA